MRIPAPTLAVAAALFALAACGADGGLDEGGGAAVPNGTSAASAPSDPSGGISADEARESGVLHAKFDARLTPTAPGRMTLENVGQAPDTYTVTLEPGGTVTPGEVELSPGETVTLVVAPAKGVTVHVSSGGRDGAGIADAELP